MRGLPVGGNALDCGPVAIANKAIVEGVIQPMIVGLDPLDRDVIWQKVYNLLRDHGQKGMPIQSLSGIDIALWDIAEKITNLPLHKLIGGAHRTKIPVYGYGMMLKPKPFEELISSFEEEVAAIKEMGFVATKMKVGP